MAKPKTPLSVEEQDDVLDESEADETVPKVCYDITSFGADYDVDGVVRRLSKGEIFAPPFQRDYVWNIKHASRFIESLLLALFGAARRTKERTSNEHTGTCAVAGRLGVSLSVWCQLTLVKPS